MDLVVACKCFNLYLRKTNISSNSITVIKRHIIRFKNRLSVIKCFVIVWQVYQSLKRSSALSLTIYQKSLQQVKHICIVVQKNIIQAFGLKSALGGSLLCQSFTEYSQD